MEPPWWKEWLIALVRLAGYLRLEIFSLWHAGLLLVVAWSVLTLTLLQVHRWAKARGAVSLTSWLAAFVGGVAILSGAAAGELYLRPLYGETFPSWLAALVGAGGALVVVVVLVSRWIFATGVWVSFVAWVLALMLAGGMVLAAHLLYQRIWVSQVGRSSSAASQTESWAWPPSLVEKPHDSRSANHR